MAVRISSKTYTTILAYLFNSQGYRMYWQTYGVNIMYLGVFCWVRERNGRIFVVV